MWRRSLVFVMGALIALPLAAGARREMSAGIDFGSAEKVVVDFEVGELRIEVGSSSRVEVELDLRCKSRSASCERRLEEVEIFLEQRGSKVLVTFDGLSKKLSNKIETECLVRIPASAELSVDMGIGDLEIEGVTQDIFVDMGIGQVSLSLPERAVGSVYLDTGIGESKVWGSDGSISSSRPFLIGSEVEWESGPGKAEIVVDLGIGEIWVDLH